MCSSLLFLELIGLDLAFFSTAKDKKGSARCLKGILKAFTYLAFRKETCVDSEKRHRLASEEILVTLTSMAGNSSKAFGRSSRGRAAFKSATWRATFSGLRTSSASVICIKSMSWRPGTRRWYQSGFLMAGGLASYLAIFCSYGGREGNCWWVWGRAGRGKGGGKGSTWI